MPEMIKERRLSDDKDERRDLLSNLIAANETEDAKFKLSDRELIANVFIFLVAGHEVGSIL
jgi:cytochrome P450